MQRIIAYTISKEQANTSISTFLKEHGYSHQVIVNLKKTPQGIQKNGVWAYVTETLCAGDVLTVCLAAEASNPSILPAPVTFSVCWEDEDILAVNKPAFLPIHPSMNHHEHTLANEVQQYAIEQGDAYPYRCVNRLDRDTTGLTLIAKHLLSSCVLGAQVRTHALRRTYLAICQGKIPESGTIDEKIARVDGSTIERCVDPLHGETAITHFWRLDYRSDLQISLVKLQLETGRTHQIRVHMKHIGHPLIGDFLYNPDHRYIQRQALHSWKLDFTHPITQKEMHLCAPLPNDLQLLFPTF